MERDLNISLIVGILTASLPVWQWDSRIDALIGVLTIALITMAALAWIKEKRAKKKTL